MYVLLINSTTVLFFMTESFVYLLRKERKLEKCSKFLELFQLNDHTAFFIVQFY